MSALERVRDRYEARPRELDPTLAKLARGDRACLPDLISGIGVLLLFLGLFLSVAQIVPFAAVYVGVVTWVGGFFWGTIAQAKSGAIRRKALENGPLVEGLVVWCEPHLESRGRAVGRAVVAFRGDEEGRFAAATLRGLADALESESGHALVRSLGEPERADARALVRVPDDYAAPGDAFLARVILHPDRLALGRVEPGETIALVVDPRSDFVEQIGVR